MEDLSKDILVVVTTFRANRERTMILHKILRHFRVKNKTPYTVILLSDGYFNDDYVDGYVDYKFSAKRAMGLHQGEHFSIKVALDFADGQGYKYLLKMGGDIICNTDEWVAHFYRLMRGHGKELLSTNWFHDNSHIFGTKFFLANCEILKSVYPESIENTLEQEVTKAIGQRYELKDIAYMINSATGERHENSNELRQADWQHAHRLYKFKNLDANRPSFYRYLNSLAIYPGVRLLYNLRKPSVSR